MYINIYCEMQAIETTDRNRTTIFVQNRLDVCTEFNWLEKILIGQNQTKKKKYGKNEHRTKCQFSDFTNTYSLTIVCVFRVDTFLAFGTFDERKNEIAMTRLTFTLAFDLPSPSVLS